MDCVRRTKRLLHEAMVSTCFFIGDDIVALIGSSTYISLRVVCVNKDFLATFPISSLAQSTGKYNAEATTGFVELTSFVFM